MAKKLYITTPFWNVVASYLVNPDEDKKYGKGLQYKMTLEPTPGELEAFQAEIMKLTGNPTFKTREPKVGISVGEESGRVTVKAVSKYKPPVFDAKNGAVNEEVRGGSVARMMCQLNVYEKGVSLVLCQVQVKDLNSGSARGSSAFTPVEGYVAADNTPEPAFGNMPAETDSKQDVDALGI